MYTDIAYLGKPHEDIVDYDNPLVVTAVGHYRVEKTWKIFTKRRLGRKDFQILYIASGKAQFFFDGEEHILSKGNVVLFLPDQPQMYFLYAKDKPETYWVHFTGRDALSVLEQFNIPTDRNVSFVGSSQDFQWMFTQMIRELRMRRHGYQQMLELNLKSLLLMIDRALNDEENISTQKLDEIEKAVHYFNQNFNKDISIEQYARDNFMKPSVFIQLFKKSTNQTPMQYITSLRIASAINLMSDKHYNISQIAAAVGYGNPLYFSRVFHKKTGLSPTEYRKKAHPKG